MRNLLFIILFVPVFSLGQTSFMTNDFKLFDKKSLTNIIKESRKLGYTIKRSNKNEIVRYVGPMDPVIHLTRKIHETNTPIGFDKYSLGFVDKILHLYDEDLEDINIWKIETMISLQPWEHFSKSTISNRFNDIDNYLNNSLRKNKYQLLRSEDIIDVQDAFGFSYDILEKKRYENRQNDSILISTGVASSIYKGQQIEKFYIITENLLYSEFMNGILDLALTSSTMSNDAFEKMKFIINGIDIREVNTYDLESMVNLFLQDCKKNNINININQKISATFKSLEENTLALAYAMDNDDEIIVIVDPMEWNDASVEKKWYIMYHELGHDVLNLKHGQGGKMMFCFAERDYTWDEFFSDKEYMFNSIKK